MRWCVDGFLEWQRIGLSEPAIIKEQRDEYRVEMDSIAMFVEECCEVNPLQKVKASELFNAYDNWAKENHQHIMSSTKLVEKWPSDMNVKNIKVIDFIME